MKETKVHKCIHLKHFRVSSIKISNVVTKETSQIIIAAETVALAEMAHKFSQSLRRLVHRYRRQGGSVAEWLERRI